jgi:uncharacterized protein (TIGR00251 family)
MKIRVRVKTNSKIEEVVKEDDIFLVRIKEPAKEGKANRATIKLLADYFRVSQRQVTISSGLGSRNKIIEISGLQ